MRNFIQEGICLTYPATAAVTSGDLVIEGAIVGVAAHDAEIGEDSTIRIEGVFSLPKAAATALIFGQPVAWLPELWLTRAATASVWRLRRLRPVIPWPMCCLAITVVELWPCQLRQRRSPV
jgi:predicted RecA/RadA family phage recombinase